MLTRQEISAEIEKHDLRNNLESLLDFIEAECDNVYNTAYETGLANGYHEGYNANAELANERIVD